MVHLLHRLYGVDAPACRSVNTADTTYNYQTHQSGLRDDSRSARCSAHEDDSPISVEHQRRTH